MWLYIFIIGASVALDQLTKYLAVLYLQPVGTMPFIPGVMQLRFLKNTGSAFSMFSGMQTFLICVTGLGLAVIAYMLFAEKFGGKFESIAMAFVLAGGIGNFIDRARQGYVVDFLDPTFMNFAVFNVADCFICVGLFVFAACVIREEIRLSRLSKESEGAADE